MLDIAQVVVDIALAALSGAALWRTFPRKAKQIGRLTGGRIPPHSTPPIIESIIPHPTVPDSMYVTYRRGAFIKKACIPSPPNTVDESFYLNHKEAQF